MAPDRRGRREADRSLPHDLDAERSLLGAVLIQNESMHVAVAIVTAADFFRAAHQTIFEAMLRLHDRGTAIDYLTLKDRLLALGKLDDVGGPAYVTSLSDGVPRSANAEHYARIIVDHSRRRMAIIAATKLSARAYDAEVDASVVVSEAAEELFALGGQASVGRAVPASEIATEVLDYIERVAQSGSLITGLRTGIDKLDEYTTGLQPAEVVVIAARTSIGKTSLLLNIALNVALANAGAVLVHSCEMSRQQLMLRMVASEARIDSHRLRVGALADSEWGRMTQAIGTISEANLLIDDAPAVSVLEVRARARAVKSDRGLALIGIDYLQLMRGRGKFENRTQEIGTITRGLKAVAKEMQVPIIVLAQLSRAPEARKDRKPQLTDLRESGDIEQDADQVWFLYRPDDSVTDAAEIIVAKQRNGPTTSVSVSWHAAYTKFENMVTREVPA